MTLDVRLETLVLAFHDPLRIARTEHGGGLASTTVVAEVRDSRWPEHVGLGEGFPDLFYGETPATMSVVMPILVVSGCGLAGLNSVTWSNTGFAIPPPASVRWPCSRRKVIW